MKQCRHTRTSVKGKKFSAGRGVKKRSSTNPVFMDADLEYKRKKKLKEEFHWDPKESGNEFMGSFHQRSAVRKVGESWTGEKFIHGPRRHAPARYSEFRVGKRKNGGKRLVLGRVKGTKKWEVQSELRPV